MAQFLKGVLSSILINTPSNGLSLSGVSFWLRVAISPLVVLLSLLMLVGLTVVIISPLFALLVISLFQVLASPFVFLLRLIGVKITDSEPMIQFTGYNFIDHIIGLTYLIWGPFRMAYVFVKYGELNIRYIFDSVNSHHGIH